MSFSYINPRNKSIFTKDLKLVALFFSITISMLFATYAFLFYVNFDLRNERTHLENTNTTLLKNIDQTKGDISKVNAQISTASQIYTRNIILKDSIQNLFDLIPDTITLSEATIEERALILSGVTPSRDVYNYMLAAPLRSLFSETSSSFYPAKDGWLNFVSKNYLTQEAFINE